MKNGRNVVVNDNAYLKTYYALCRRLNNYLTNVNHIVLSRNKLKSYQSLLRFVCSKCMVNINGM